MNQSDSKLKQISKISLEDIASICDHTFLNRSEAYRNSGIDAPSKRKEEFYSFLNETINFKYLPYAICVRPEDVSWAKKFLDEHQKKVVIASVVGFPDGSWYSTKFKLAETRLALEDGAQEIDMVLNYERLKQKDLEYVEKEIEAIVDLVHRYNGLLKLIFENCQLDNQQIKTACQIAEKLKVDFIKTSTGFGKFGAKSEHLKIMRENFSRGVKIAGGVRPENLTELLSATSGRTDGDIDLDPKKIRIGESSLLKKLIKK